MKIAIFPMNIQWGNVEKNLQSIAIAISNIDADTDILVLPELFSTGFLQDINDVATLAEPISGDTITVIKRLAMEYGLAIAGSFLCRVGEKFYNRSFFIEPSGEETYYDKRHLFSLSKEPELLSQGDKLPPIVRYRGWNISLTICYDLRFPVWCRNRESKYDIMLVPANWPASRAYAWKHLLIGRAIENQACYVGANRGGADDFGDYENLSLAVNALGVVVTNEKTDNGFVYAEFDRDELIKIRKKLPFGNDADDFQLTNGCR